MNEGEINYLLENAILKEIFDGLERECMEIAVNARPDDDEMRRSALGEVRAIRSVRWKLKALLSAKTNPPQDAVV